jgi:hypothetical protein
MPAAEGAEAILPAFRRPSFGLLKKLMINVPPGL